MFLRRFFRERVFFVSYPKSGRTWLRAMLGSYFALKYEGDNAGAFPDVRELSDKNGLPKIKFTHDGASMQAGLSYKDLRSGHRDYRKKKVVFVGRDVRDTLVSAYFQAVKRVNVYEGSVSEFLRSDKYGADKILSFYQFWHSACNEPRAFLYTSYELMHEDARRELSRVLSFMDIEVDDDLVRKAVDACSFNNMRKMEKSGEGTSSAFRPADMKDEESYKARKGKVGTYSENLSEEDINYINERALAYGVDLYDPWNSQKSH
ncbi:sulfotransferase domain-containing protein [Chromohalobacter israelensis]|uniref:sulfotransferase domain-containing protein n=1 Tax=Chromohalobacter israelensis TaxID=141390 RepID=UPI000FFED379|nr:sulfotransferase domain-containing protein [Chromohalobacter salexigens]RXE48162.1 hypothetical protein B4O83_09320 [Chromohalobacter salexigens]